MSGDLGKIQVNLSQVSAHDKVADLANRRTVEKGVAAHEQQDLMSGLCRRRLGFSPWALLDSLSIKWTPVQTPSPA